jgi:hypothetical protein
MPRNACRRGPERGNALVEFTLLLPLVSFLFLGGIEFGLIYIERAQLTQSCREGVRSAAVGKTLAEIRSTVRNAAPRLGIADQQIAIEYQLPATAIWSPAMDDLSGTGNNIPADALCRVGIEGWEHRMVSGSFLNFVPGVRNSRFAMTAREVMIRAW